MYKAYLMLLATCITRKRISYILRNITRGIYNLHGMNYAKYSNKRSQKLRHPADYISSSTEIL